MVARIGGAPPPAAPIYAVQDAFADLFEGNERYAAIEHEVAASGVARRGLAIVTCIDSRIDPLAVFGLAQGDAKILRNAGARVTDDVLRTLVVAAHLLDVDRVLLVPHTRCRMATVSPDELHEAIRERSGLDTRSLDLRPVTDARQALREDLRRVRSWPFLPPGISVTGAIYDVDTGALEQVDG